MRTMLVSTHHLAMLSDVIPEAHAPAGWVEKPPSQRCLYRLGTANTAYEEVSVWSPLTSPNLMPR
jgi:hypothetical protein